MWTFTLAMTGVTLALVLIMLAYMCYMAAERNGWKVLAGKYRLKGRFSGRRFPFRSAGFNGFAFHLTLVLGANEQGLYLRPILPVRLFHAALLLPWDELESESFRATHSEGRRLRIPGPDPETPLLELDLGDQARQPLLESLQPGWQAARRALGSAS